MGYKLLTFYFDSNFKLMADHESLVGDSDALAMIYFNMICIKVVRIKVLFNHAHVNSVLAHVPTPSDKLINKRLNNG